MNSFVTCPRCGAAVQQQGMGRHAAACERLAAPEDLRAEMERDGLTVKGMAARHGCSWITMKNRLDAPGGAAPAALLRPCLRCGLNLDHPFVPDAGNGLCAMCALRHEEPNANWAVRVVG